MEGGPCPQDIKGRGPLLLEVVLGTGTRTPGFAPAQAQLLSLQRGERSRAPKVGACTVISGGTWRSMFNPDSSVFFYLKKKN